MNAKQWTPNLHAHVVFDWTQPNGKSVRLLRAPRSRKKRRGRRTDCPVPADPLRPNTNTVPVQLPPRIAPRLSAVGGSAGLAGVLAYSAHGISLLVLGYSIVSRVPAICDGR